jgi:hypothetical protein
MPLTEKLTMPELFAKLGELPGRSHINRYTHSSHDTDNDKRAAHHDRKTTRRTVKCVTSNPRMAMSGIDIEVVQKRTRRRMTRLSSRGFKNGF